MDIPTSRRAALAAAALLAVLAAGCRTVWVHPEATAARYAADVDECRYGASKASATPAAARRAPSHAWKTCMIGKGWTTRVGSRGQPPWDLPRAPRSGKQGALAR